MESRFGHDFSGVRVHTDAKAAESAQDLNANAYTVGSNIVFAAGQFAPETQLGRQLLSHELTHVVQQQGSPVSVARGVSDPGDCHERQAGAVADAFTRGDNIVDLLDSGSGPTDSSVQRQTPQSKSPSPAPSTAQPQTTQPIHYDRTAHHREKPLDPALKARDVRALLDAEVNKGDRGEITSYELKGRISGNAEIFLLALLYSLAQRSRWGTEADVVTDLDWPSNTSPTPPRGRATVRIDAKGAASVELIGLVPVSQVSQQTTAVSLQGKFAAVTDDGTAKWTPAELNDVAGAIAMLPPNDADVLKEVELIRVATIPGKPDDAGQFEWPSSAATDFTSVNIRPKLRLANLAFSHNDVQFFGGTEGSVPASYQAILHEVGHAIETEVYRSKWKAHAQALADTKAAGDAQESDARKKERTELEEKIKTAKNPTEKNRLEKKLVRLNLDLALAADKATDKKAIETKLKEKEKEVLDMDKAGQSQRLTKFLEVVNGKYSGKRIPPITDYAGQGPREFYAEAYSLWRVDPEFLRNNYPDIYRFFQSGDYRR
jgi:hypothetical protein